MDPVTMVVAALSAGAAAGLTDTAKQAVNDAFRSVKGLITRQYPAVDIDLVETQPQSEAQRAALVNDLRQAGAANDRELLSAARQLLLVVHQCAPQVLATARVVVRESRAGELEITEITSSGHVQVEVGGGTQVEGSIKIGGVHAGMPELPHPPAARR